MGDPRGLLTVQRAVTGDPRRNPVERVRDYHEVIRLLPLTNVREQARRCMQCGVPFCHRGCPLGNLIPEWNELVYHGRLQDAIDRLHATNNFPEFTGFTCPAPCEPACIERWMAGAYHDTVDHPARRFRPWDCAVGGLCMAAIPPATALVALDEVLAS